MCGITMTISVHGVRKMREYIVEKKQTSVGWTWVEPRGKLIRCKDCEYFCTYKDGSVDCDNMNGMVLPSEDGFCSFAERKK